MAARDPILRRLGDYLRSVREDLGLSQEALAFKCNLHRTFIGSIERGEANVTILTLRKVTDALGTSIVDAAQAMVGSSRGRRGKK